jgi:hypothetical protein
MTLDFRRIEIALSEHFISLDFTLFRNSETGDLWAERDDEELNLTAMARYVADEVTP